MSNKYQCLYAGSEKLAFCNVLTDKGTEVIFTMKGKFLNNPYTGEFGTTILFKPLGNAISELEKVDAAVKEKSNLKGWDIKSCMRDDKTISLKLKKFMDQYVFEGPAPVKGNAEITVQPGYYFDPEWAKGGVYFKLLKVDQ